MSYEVNNKLWIDKQKIEINSFGLHVNTYIINGFIIVLKSRYEWDSNHAWTTIWIHNYFNFKFWKFFIVTQNVKHFLHAYTKLILTKHKPSPAHLVSVWDTLASYVKGLSALWVIYPVLTLSEHQINLHLRQTAFKTICLLK